MNIATHVTHGMVGANCHPMTAPTSRNTKLMPVLTMTSLMVTAAPAGAGAYGWPV